ncbi:hypothetical protein HK096_006636 [Nowakowskiella sp. JEL0078]|nr:hypothetical protein HK096_006636 [Nowakowskiella sp. JEL0078]
MGSCGKVFLKLFTILNELNFPASIPAADPRLELLQFIPNFKALPVKASNLLAAKMEEFNVSKGTVIVSEGDNNRYVYLIASGEAEVSNNKDGKKTEKQKILKKGNWVGLSAMLENSFHSTTLTAITDPNTKTYRISYDAFNKILNEESAIGVAIAKYLTQELREIHDSVKLESKIVASTVKEIENKIEKTVETKLNDDKTIVMTIFDHKSYEKPYFDSAISKFNSETGFKLVCKYIELKLTKETAIMASGSKIVCIFVNDDASEDVLGILHTHGVQMIALRCAGFNNCDLKACQDLEISVVRVPAYSPYAVAEHCVALLLALNRKIHLAYNRVKTGNFSLNNLVGFDLHGKTIGVIGTGKVRIGFCFIQIMLGFGCNVLGYDMYKNKELENTENFRYVDDIKDLLISSQVISIHCPLMPENKYMINCETLKLLPKGAIIINTSRGALINTIDLIQSLKEGHIGGAGLDVYENETEYFFEDKSCEVLGDDILARLLSFQNVVITSHQAFLTEEALTAIANVTISNIKEFSIDKKAMKSHSNTRVRLSFIFDRRYLRHLISLHKTPPRNAASQNSEKKHAVVVFRIDNRRWKNQNRRRQPRRGFSLHALESASPVEPFNFNASFHNSLESHSDIQEVPLNQIPKLNIVILIVGSRGDVQPFLALGQELKKWGHKVRLATHETFRKFVQESELEFYPLGGDPAELMTYMVKNPGLLPSVDSVAKGDIGKKRSQMKEIIESTWLACTQNENDSSTKYVADAIIANPPSFGHIHIAEKLGIPLHIFFTMPWSQTSAFPSPLTLLTSSGKITKIMNTMSYDFVEIFTFQGLGDIINDFRTKTLELEPLAPTVGPFLMKILEIPHTYCWSPSLIPKPNDWGAHIDVCGFFFLDLATQSNYTPPNDLLEFLENGEKPIYVGFGSIVVDDPNGFTEMIFDAVRKSGVRIILSKGWGGIGNDKLDIPSNVYLIGNCPHDWLFQKVSAVCHHGGAGTTAAGLKAGKPTIIVPFFGDQTWWGSMVAAYGVGPAPIQFKQLTAKKLAHAFEIATSKEMSEKAQSLATLLNQENGLREGVRSFHHHLPLDKITCEVFNGKSSESVSRAEIARHFIPEMNKRVSDKGLISLKSQGHKFTTVEEYKPVCWSVPEKTVGKAVVESVYQVKSWTESLVSAGIDTARGALEMVDHKTKEVSEGISESLYQTTKGIVSATKDVSEGISESLSQTTKGIALASKSVSESFSQTTKGIVLASTNGLSESKKLTSAEAENVATGFSKGIFKAIYFPTSGTEKFWGHVSSPHEITSTDQNSNNSKAQVKNSVESAKEGPISFLRGFRESKSEVNTNPKNISGTSTGTSITDLLDSKGVYKYFRKKLLWQSPEEDISEAEDETVQTDGFVFVEMGDSSLNVTVVHDEFDEAEKSSDK